MIEAIRYFDDEDVATDFFAKLGWPEGAGFDRCGGAENYYLSTRRGWKGKGCSRQFSVKVGTIFGDSPLGLDKWLPAVWLIAKPRNCISSHELGRALGVTQKSALFMVRRIRPAMQTGSFEKINGVAEADETFVGGLSKNMHAKERREQITGTSAMDKTILVGVPERGGSVRARFVPDRSAKSLMGFINDNAAENSTLYTDLFHTYAEAGQTFQHAIVDRNLGEYVNELVHTNGSENFWSIPKRTIKGTPISINPEHLLAYVDERVFAFNNRKGSNFDRSQSALTGVAHRRLAVSSLRQN